MAIQNRRGVYSDFTPTKMVPGEIAVVQSGDPNNSSGKAVYTAFGTSGDVKRLATEDDLSGKVDKVTGKGLSTNDYTTEEKTKLAGIEAQANKTVIDSTLTQTGQAADAKAVGDAIASVTIETDKTLTEEDVPADAKVVGDELTDIKSDLSQLEEEIQNIEPLSEDAKTALLNCFQHVAWIDEHGQDYYDALESALYADSYPRITAVFNAGTNTIYTDDSLDSLKQYMTVKYFETEESTGVTINSSDYTLSGTLREGTSIVSVSYNDIRTDVNIQGVVDYYNKTSWNLNELVKFNGTSNINDSGVFINSAAPYGDCYRTFLVDKGKTPRVSGVSGNYYPIPVPDDAVSIHFSIEPSSMYVRGFVVEYLPSSDSYHLLYGAGWGQGTSQKVFDTVTSTKKYAVAIAKATSSGSDAFTTEPTALSITFGEG